jgi:hypothetical protein
MIRRRATVVAVRSWHPSSFTRSDGSVPRRRRFLLDDANSTVADSIARQKECSALQVSGMVLSVGTLLSHFLLLYLARKFRKRPPPTSKVRANVVSMSEGKGIDVDDSYAPRISIPSNPPKLFTKPFPSIYGGSDVQQWTYRKWSSESSSSSADSHRLPQLPEPSHRLPQLPEPSCSRDREWRRPSASVSFASSSSRSSRIPKASSPSPHQKAFMTDTPLTTNTTESVSSDYL